MFVKSSIILSFFCTLLVFSQAKQNSYEREEVSNTSVFKDYSPDEEGSVTFKKMKYENPSKELPVLTLLKYESRDLFLGNECVKEETAKMGFKYVVVCQPKVSFGTKVWLFFFNFGSNVELTFKNGFGWETRVKEKIIACKKSSGDFVW